MKIDKLQEIRQILVACDKNILNGTQDLALARLHYAVSLILEELHKTDVAASQAANTASCLANGIQPD